mgnify:CR=1 FL=1
MDEAVGGVGAAAAEVEEPEAGAMTHRWGVREEGVARGREVWEAPAELGRPAAAEAACTSNCRMQKLRADE